MKIKNYLSIFIVMFILPMGVYGQIANYNHYPTLKPSHILDEKLTNISFSLSMRVLESDYTGPLVRLRRASDNAELDFSWGDDDIVDIVAINTWRSGSDVFIHTWYDQSGLGRDAVQTTANSQPRFFPVTTPHFQGDGSNDHLTVDTPNGIQDVTNNGNEGTVLVVMRATTKSQHTFGVLSSGDRWSTHVNWSNNNLYFDPGICCDQNRFIANGSNVGVWVQYTFVKTTANVIIRLNAVDNLNASHTNGVCTRTEDFAIGWATGNQSSNHATTSFTEFIMYRINIATAEYQEIENNAITFWGL